MDGKGDHKENNKENKENNGYNSDEKVIDIALRKRNKRIIHDNDDYDDYDDHDKNNKNSAVKRTRNGTNDDDNYARIIVVPGTLNNLNVLPVESNSVYERSPNSQALVTHLDDNASVVVTQDNNIHGHHAVEISNVTEILNAAEIHRNGDDEYVEIGPNDFTEVNAILSNENHKYRRGLIEYGHYLTSIEIAEKKLDIIYDAFPTVKDFTDNKKLLLVVIMKSLPMHAAYHAFLLDKGGFVASYKSFVTTLSGAKYEEDPKYWYQYCEERHGLKKERNPYTSKVKFLLAFRKRPHQYVYLMLTIRNFNLNCMFLIRILNNLRKELRGECVI